jgi:hypothetical protein
MDRSPSAERQLTSRVRFAKQVGEPRISYLDHGKLPHGSQSRRLSLQIKFLMRSPIFYRVIISARCECLTVHGNSVMAASAITIPY